MKTYCNFILMLLIVANFAYSLRIKKSQRIHSCHNENDNGSSEPYINSDDNYSPHTEGKVHTYD
jgi:hypothetical protein